MKQKVLIIGVGSETFEKVAPMLERDSVDVDRFPRAEASLELLSVVTFDTLLVGYPLAGMATEEFLERVRKEGMPNQKTPLLLLTEEATLEEARGWIGRGANRVVPLSVEAEDLQSTVSGLLKVAPRLGIRVMANLEIQVDEGTTLAVCQTENLSATGMLIRTLVGYPLGTRLGFEFNLPLDPRAVKGEAEVVRHTLSGRERIRGVGVRFVSFEGDGQRRFESYLEESLEVAPKTLEMA